MIRTNVSSLPLQAAGWIERLALKKHPEGGWYKEEYRASEYIPVAGLPSRFDGERAFCTSIYFLLTGDEFSALHRIRQDELWHFYDGDGLTVHVISPDGQYVGNRLGRNHDQGESLMHVVEAGNWFGASVTAGGFALVGCTVAPGFDFADFELPARSELLERYPYHDALIRRLTR